jgi:threonine/homoserine/homoserine lactone efflux protein
VSLGLALLGLAAALGLAALLAASPAAWEVLRLAGVGYLLWIAFDTWRGPEAAEAHESAAAGLVRQFRRGLITNALNPKAAVFYITVMPGFLPPAPGFAAVSLQSFTYVAVATGVHAGIVLAAATAQGWLADEARVTRARRVMAVALVGVAIWLYLRT